jgi:spore photoproduct lyase
MWERGHITSASKARAEEGTTYEASCYRDPLAIEHLTGSLAKAIRRFDEWKAPVQLRFTTKYDNVDSLLALAHNHHTRIRFSINSDFLNQTKRLTGFQSSDVSHRRTFLRQSKRSQ